MSYFPLVLIPSAIEQTRTAQPEIPPLSLPVPSNPGNQPSKINKTSIAIQSAIAVILSFVIGDIAGSSLVGTLILIGGSGGITFRAWQQFNNYSQRKKEYQEKVGIYKRKLKENEQQKRLHRQRIEAEQTPDKIAEFRYKLLLNMLSRTIPHDSDNSKAQPGYSEAHFHTYLKRYFSNNIYTGLALKIPNFDFPYSPDFAYIDSNINLYIDIEIDEPYAYESSQATHYLAAQKDERRNKFFLNRSWIIIRFSEEQIVRYPESCCKTIAETIAYLLDNNLVLSQFKNVSSLSPMKQWTHEEAEKMAEKQYRKTYL